VSSTIINVDPIRAVYASTLALTPRRSKA